MDRLTARARAARLLPSLRGAAAAAPLLLLGPVTALSQSAAGDPGALHQNAADAGPTQLAPMRVTTDTAEYCDTLASLVTRAERAQVARDTHAAELQQVRDLVEEGHHMCADGLIRSGLLRLRRALMILRAGH
jgi:hypothetical protein